MMRCARCLQHVSTGAPTTCPSCAWRSLRRGSEPGREQELDTTAWQAFFGRLQIEDDRLRRLRQLALLLGENPADAAARAIGAPGDGSDEAAFRAELMRLAEQLLARIDEF